MASGSRATFASAAAGACVHAASKILQRKIWIPTRNRQQCDRVTAQPQTVGGFCRFASGAALLGGAAFVSTAPTTNLRDRAPSSCQ